MLSTQKIDYQDGSTQLEGFLAIDNKFKGKRPAVLIAHDWSGKTELTCKKAEKIAELGYVGFALDMFGKGVVGTTNEEKTALIQPFMQDRKLLQHRIEAALATLQKIDDVDTSKIAAIGFCFGGLCVLDLARSGADVKGVVSFHGLLVPRPQPSEKIKAKILVLHGYDDPMGKPEQVIEFANEMTEAKANWEIVMYGNTMHAFTNPNAHDPNFGTVYNKEAATRSWIAMKDFFTEIFA